MVNDMAGEIILRANEVAARNKLAQQEMGMQRQNQMMQSMGQLGQAVADWQKQTALKKQNLAELEAWGASGMIPDEVLNKLSGERDENKIAGQLQVLRYLGEKQGRMDYLTAQSNAAANLAAWKQGLEGQEPPKRQIVETADGLMAVNPQTGIADPVLGQDGQPVKGRPRGSGMDTMMGLMMGGPGGVPGGGAAAPAGSPDPAAPAGGSQYRVGQRARNPQTGEVREWNGSAWVPVQ